MTIYRHVRLRPAEHRQQPPTPAATVSASPAPVAAAEPTNPVPADPPPPPAPGVSAQVHRIVRKPRSASPAKLIVVVPEAPAGAVTEAPREVVVSEEKSVTTEETKASEIVSTVPNQDSTPPVSAEAAAAPGAGATPEAASTRSNSGKRLVKAVGRFLHLGGKR